jgi:hypothetical protein
MRTTHTKIGKIACILLLACFLNDTKACEDFFFVQADTVNLYQFVNAYKQSPGKKTQTKKYFQSCPVCYKNINVVPVVYGYPTIEMARQARGGELIMGGCIPDKKRTSYCRKDKYYF